MPHRQFQREEIYPFPIMALENLPQLYSITYHYHSLVIKHQGSFPRLQALLQAQMLNLENPIKPVQNLGNCTFDSFLCHVVPANVEWFKSFSSSVVFEQSVFSSIDPSTLKWQRS